MGRSATACALIERRPMPPLGHFSLIRFARTSRFVGGLARSGRGNGEMAAHPGDEGSRPGTAPGKCGPLGKPAKFP